MAKGRHEPGLGPPDREKRRQGERSGVHEALPVELSLQGFLRRDLKIMSVIFSDEVCYRYRLVGTDCAEGIEPEAVGADRRLDDFEYLGANGLLRGVDAADVVSLGIARSTCAH